MTKEKIIEILYNADCKDPCDCLFNLFDYDEKYNSICRATDIPQDPYEMEEGCPFCKMLAEMLERGQTE